MMVASALKCYCLLSFLCVLNYMFVKEKCKTKICFALVEFNVFNTFSSRCTLSLAPENIRKPNWKIWCFQGLKEE